jgi:hypothetical protein
MTLRIPQADIFLPLPKGEGWGEGEGGVHISVAQDPARALQLPSFSFPSDFELRTSNF